MKPLRFLLLFVASVAGAQTFETAFLNPIAEGADPWVVRGANGQYLWCASDGNRGVAVYQSPRLTSLGEKHLVWRAPETGPYSRQIWAPELHELDGHWYAYVAASDGKNENHRMIVLESAAADPLGDYHFKAELYTGDEVTTRRHNRWAIDGTILALRGRRYFVWSGWRDERDVQWLYIAEMANPWTIRSNRVRLCANDDYVWERVGEKPTERGLAEAPQVLQHDGRTFLTYSTSSSWQPTYKLGLLELARDGDPLDPAAWHKSPVPVFQSTAQVYGVGHNAFALSPSGTEDWLVFHAKMDRGDGWKRAIYVQPFHWRADGQPDFGPPLPPRTPLPLPAGEIRRGVAGAFHSELRDDLRFWDYYGHHELFRVDPAGVRLGGEPAGHVNAFSSGEKLILRDRAWSDCVVRAKLRVVAGGRPAGILFRTTAVSLGFDAQCGYFAGIAAERNEVILGRTDGEHWTLLAQANAPVAYERDHLLEISAVGSEITVSLNGERVLQKNDATWSRGTIGLRVTNSEVIFSELTVADK
jgi:GH43 family beta-xylosidase